MNSVNLTGRIVTDVKCREFMKGGKTRKAYSFTLAVRCHFRNSEGKYESDYVNCVYYTQHTLNCKKLESIAVTGEWKSRRYKDKEDRWAYTQYCNVLHYEHQETYKERKDNKEDAGQEEATTEEAVADDVELTELSEYEANLLHILDF